MPRSFIAVSVALCFVLGCKTTEPTPDPAPNPETPESSPAAAKEAAEAELAPCGDDDEMCRVDRLGQVTVGTWDGSETPAELIAEWGEPEKKGERFTEEASGDIVEMWTWSAKGVTVEMLATDMSGAPAMSRGITVRAPYAGKTDRGVGIGSTEEEVLEAYAGIIDPAGTQDGSMVVAGSIYGGVFFTIVEGKVTEIFVGAGAE